MYQNLKVLLHFHAVRLRESLERGSFAGATSGAILLLYRYWLALLVPKIIKRQIKYEKYLDKQK